MAHYKESLQKIWHLYERMHGSVPATAREVPAFGSVIAYEGLCRFPHRVDTLVTIGSPLASPDLILKPLRERLRNLLGHSATGPLPWPGVKRWINVYAETDVWCVPVKGLGQFIDPAHRKDLRDVAVHHGSTFRPTKTHALESYLRKNPELSDILAEVI